MSRVSNDPQILLSAGAAMAADGNANMGALLTITFTTDAPAAADKTLTIPDGDVAGVTGAEMANLAREAAGAFATVRSEYNRLLTEIRQNGLNGAARVPAMATLLTVVYTTDAPSITPNGAITIADGDATLVRAEFNEMAEELESALGTIKTKHNEIRTALMGITSSTSSIPTVADLGALLTITYTTDDPATTANGAVTIADGDAATATVATAVELYDEIEAALATIRSTYNTFMGDLRQMGAMR